MDGNLAHREQLVVERLLEDERLTADLNDAAANALLDWGVRQTKEIVADTAALSNEEAEAAMYPRLRGLRTVMRYANNWFGKRGTADLDKNLQLIRKVLVKTAVIHPNTFTPAGEAEQLQFAQETHDRSNPVQLVNIFCAWIDLQTETFPPTSILPPKGEEENPLALRERARVRGEQKERGDDNE